MQTPPTTPISGNNDSHMDYRRVNGSPVCVLFAAVVTPTKRNRIDVPSSYEDDVPGTPPSSGSLSLRGLLFPGTGGVPEISSGPPPAPSKLIRKKYGSEKPKSLALKGLVILKILWQSIANLGTGSFGTVDKVVLLPASGSPTGTPCSPPVAMKTVNQSERQGPKTLRGEAANVGSPGCASGVAATNDDGDLFIFTPVAVPLSKMGQIEYQFLEEIISLMRNSIMDGPLRVILDLKLENLGFIPQGTATVVPDEKGQPSIGPPTQEKKVVILDLGNFLDAEDTDPKSRILLALGMTCALACTMPTPLGCNTRLPLVLIAEMVLLVILTLDPTGPASQMLSKFSSVLMNATRSGSPVPSLAEAP